MPEPDDGTEFEVFDLKMMLGYGLIAWALALSFGLALYLNS